MAAASPEPAPAPPQTPRSRRALPALLGALLALVHAGLWSFSLPENGGPDEPNHVDVASYLARHGRIAVTGDHELSYSVYQASYAPLPPLPYAVAAAPLALGRTLVDHPAPHRWARLANLLWAAVLGAFTCLLGAQLWPARGDLQLGFAALLLGVPQVGFLLGYFSSDGMLLAASVVFLWALLGTREAPTELRWRLRLGIAVALVLGSRLNGYPLVALGLAWLPLAGPGSERGSRLRAAVFGGALGTACVSPWLVHNALLYGDPLGFRAMFFPGAFEAMRAQNQAMVTTHFGGYGAAFLDYWATNTFRSSVGVFGYMTYTLPGWVYAATLCGLGLSATGWALQARRAWTSSTGRRVRDALRSPFALCFLVPAVLALVSLRQSMVGDLQAQGRYLFAGLGCVSACAVQGWRGLFPPSSDARPWLWLVGVMPALAIWGWALGISQYPRSVDFGGPGFEDFAGSARDLSPHLKIHRDPQGFALVATGGDPHFELPPLARPQSGLITLTVDLTTPEGNGENWLQVYHREQGRPYVEDRSARVELTPGERQVYTVRFPARNAAHLRLDPGSLPGRYLLHGLQISAEGR
jgi:hypothetical protein